MPQTASRAESLPVPLPTTQRRKAVPIDPQPSTSTPSSELPPPSRPPPAPEGRGFLGAARETLEVVQAAMMLRDEQVKATVQYYGADQSTNAELDEITAAVVSELEALRLVGEQQRPSAIPDVETELIFSLQDLLEKLFSPQRRNFIERKILDIQRRITQLFFDSELYARLAADAGDVTAVSYPEQALYYALSGFEQSILGALDEMPVENDEVRRRARDRYLGFTRQLCSEFLSRTTPELERLLAVYREVLTEFFYSSFKKRLGDLCRSAIVDSQVAVGHRLGYKVKADRFADFREAFDRHFLERLVDHLQEPIREKAAEGAEEFRAATTRFVKEPRIHSEICSVINDAIYDYLHDEGFLDLPTDWRRMLHRR